jgi:Uma2 family endonuclease
MQERVPKGQPEIRPLEEVVASIPREPEAFLAWCIEHGDEHPYRFELSQGEISVQQRVSRWHNRVATNLARHLDALLDLDRFDVMHSEFSVQIVQGYRAPDVLVEPLRSENSLTSSDPIFLSQVLSPTSVKRDLIDKAGEYGMLPSVQAYLVCSQDGPIAWLWARRANGKWPKSTREIKGRDKTFHVPGLDVELSMAAIYRNIPDFPDEA